MRPVRIMIFAKAPMPGRVKTRLIPSLGAEGAAGLAQTMLLSTIREALAAKIGIVELCVDPSPSDPSWRDLLPRGAVQLSGQGPGDLGERLARAAARIINDGAWPLFIGTDCPALDRHALRSIATELDTHDAVIQPALDGGYVALGLTGFDPSLFDGIAWSTSSVAEVTIARIRALGWSLFQGPALRDIDEPADLDALGECS